MFKENSHKCLHLKAKRGLIPSVLTGVFPKATLEKMNRKRMEEIVQILIELTASLSTQKNNENRLCRPKWWPNNVHYPLEGLREQIQTHTTKWRGILRLLIASCSTFFKTEEFLAPLFPNGNYSFVPRTVLIPTQDNINTAKQQQNSRRKRKISEEYEYKEEIKKPKVKQHANLRTRVSISKKKLHSELVNDKCLARNAYVLLRDIFRDIPLKEQNTEVVDKSEYLAYFNLGTPNSQSNKKPNTIKRNPVRLCFMPTIPYSSDIGRALMQRENLQIPNEVHLRRIDRIEWYLNKSEAVVSNNHTYDVSYEERSENGDFHSYTFPKRQNHQTNRSLKREFLDYILKPAVVHLKRVDLEKLKEQYKTQSN